MLVHALHIIIGGVTHLRITERTSHSICLDELVGVRVELDWIVVLIDLSVDNGSVVSHVGLAWIHVIGVAIENGLKRVLAHSLSSLRHVSIPCIWVHARHGLDSIVGNLLAECLSGCSCIYLQLVLLLLKSKQVLMAKETGVSIGIIRIGIVGCGCNALLLG
jgi:hypothetical protein